jgi:hypothetical protein
MKSLIVFNLLIAVASACGNNAYRCVGNGSVEDDWKHTNACCAMLFEETCYCSHRAETYCDPSGGNIQKFKDCCDQWDNYYAREC